VGSCNDRSCYYWGKVHKVVLKGVAVDGSYSNRSCPLVVCLVDVFVEKRVVEESGAKEGEGERGWEGETGGEREWEGELGVWRGWEGRGDGRGREGRWERRDGSEDKSYIKNFDTCVSSRTQSRQQPHIGKGARESWERRVAHSHSQYPSSTQAGGWTAGRLSLSPKH